MSNIYKPQLNYVVPQSQAQLTRPMTLQPTATERLIGQGLKGLEEVATIAAKEYVRIKSTEVADSLNQFKSDLAREKIRFTEENKGKNALDAEQHFANYARQKAQEYGKDFEGQFRDSFNQDAAATSLNFADQGAAYASQERQAWKQSVLKGDLTEFQNTIAQNFKDVDYINHQTSAIKQRIQEENLGMDVSAELAKIDKASVATQIDGYLSEGNIKVASTIFKANRGALGDDVFTYSQKIKNAQEALERRAEANRNKAVRSILKGYKDAEYAAQYQGDISGLNTIYQQLKAVGADLEASQIKSESDMYRYANEARITALDSDLRVLSQNVAELTQDLAANYNKMTTQEHKKKSAALEVSSKILNSRVSLLKEDPANAADVDPRVVYPDDATGEDRAAIRIEYQKSNYVPQAVQKVLTKQESAQLGSQFNNASTEQKVALLFGEGGVMEQYGRYAGKAVSEMGVDPLSQGMINRAWKDPYKMTQVKAFFALKDIDDKEIPKAPTGTVKAQDLLSDSELYQSYMSMAATTYSPEAIEAAKQMENLTDKALRLGWEPDRVLDMFDKGVTIINDTNMNIVLEDQIDADELEDSLNDYASSNLNDFISQQFTKDYQREDNVNRLLETGIWVNAPDGNGYVMVDPTTGSPVINMAGEYFTYGGE